MSDKKKVLLSGIKPTGTLHIGNYFGAMKQMVDMQDEFESYIFVANYHAMTTAQNKEELEKQTMDIAMDYLAVGLDPEKVTLFLQSDVPEVAELAWVFNCITTMPYLQRAHAYKDAQAKDAEINVGVFDYPILMAADILVQDADVVPVGKDQKQHVEYARDIAEKFNRVYEAEVFKLPEPAILEDVATVPGIDGRKMSKSYGNVIPLFGSPDEIKKAVMAIVTDSTPVEEPKDPEACNVFALHKLFSQEQLGEIEARYREGGMGYGDSKKMLLENVIAKLAQFRERRLELEQNPEYVRDVLRAGAEKARARVSAKLKQVREATGIITTL